MSVRPVLAIGSTTVPRAAVPWHIHYETLP